MTTSHETPSNTEAITPDGFDVLDACHRQTVIALGRLAALVTRLSTFGADDEARVLAREVVTHFETVARPHHQDEERHVFPQLLETGDAPTVQAVRSLQQDHLWLDEDWRELLPLVDAVASGHASGDLESLRAGVGVFHALSIAHIALEESFIYPQARATAGAAERLAMGREMAARRRADPRTPS
jgi:iron-sulfur cluster repair protein YtfE (RIC family)